MTVGLSKHPRLYSGFYNYGIYFMIRSKSVKCYSNLSLFVKLYNRKQPSIICLISKYCIKILYS